MTIKLMNILWLDTFNMFAKIINYVKRNFIMNIFRHTKHNQDSCFEYHCIIRLAAELLDVRRNERRQQIGIYK